MDPIEAAIHADLSAPRALPPQVIVHLAAHHDVEMENVGEFLSVQLPGLEDYHFDLILSPAFTPKLEDQARYSPLLQSGPVPSDQIAPLIRSLELRPTVARFSLPAGGECLVPLREVILDRYVRRLQLEKVVPEPVAECIRHLVPKADQDRLHAIARRPVWQEAWRSALLLHALTSSLKREAFAIADFELLLRLVEQYEPSQASELMEWLPEIVQGMETEIAQHSVPKPFFSDRIREMHGGTRDHRASNQSAIEGRIDEIAALRRLGELLASPR